MPDYCTGFPVNEVPPVSEMEFFKPYFDITMRETSLEVVFKVPNSCYEITSITDGYPAQGPCGDPNDYQCLIKIAINSNCTNTGEKLLSCTLDYTEDPNGNPINIYVEDITTPVAICAGHSISVKKVL